MIHAVVVESEGQYVAQCLEVAAVTQGASLDELLGNLREAWTSVCAMKIPSCCLEIPSSYT